MTSGSPAPSLGKHVGLAYLPIQYTEIDQLLEVEVRGKRIQAKVVPTPFYKR